MNIFSKPKKENVEPVVVFDANNSYNLGSKNYKLQKLVNARLIEIGLSTDPKVYFKNHEDVIPYIKSLKSKKN